MTKYLPKVFLCLLFYSVCFPERIYAYGPDGIKTPCGFSVSFNKTDVRCAGENSGSATVVISGPPSLAPYQFEWFDGTTSATRNGLSKGTYFVKVTDNTGCFSNYFVTINEPNLLTLTLIKTDLICYESPDGAIDLSVTGGNPGAYTYRWLETGDNVQDLNNLLAGTYTVEVEDSKNCMATASVTLTQPLKLESTYRTDSVKCNGGSDGEINLTVSGGVPIYTYAWSNGSILQDAFELSAGDYSVTITDGNGCKLTKTIPVKEPLPIVTSFDITNARCYGFNDGQIDLTVNGGTLPYSFTWSTSEIVLGETTEDLIKLPRDTYYVTIKDANNCIYLDSTEVKESILLITNLDVTNVTCYDGDDGGIDLTVTGGILPYSYLWTNNSTSEDLSGIRAGRYAVTIADFNGCTAVASIEVKQPDDLSMGFDISEVSCKDNDDGAIVLHVSGASPPYSFQWSNGITTQHIYDQPGGIYTISVTDSHNCPFTASIQIPVNPRACINVVTIPTAFSPNGDSYNDVWVIHDYQLYPSIAVKVINQWGETVFNSNGYHEPFDGKRNGKDLPAGAYYYLVNLGNGDSSFTGTVTIVR